MILPRLHETAWYGQRDALYSGGNDVTLLTGGDQGPAVVPGEPERSLLVQALAYDLDDLKMPPDRKLDAEILTNFRKWIKAGAPYPKAEKKRPRPDRGSPALPRAASTDR